MNTSIDDSLSLEVLEIGVLIKGIQEVQNSLETKLVLILKKNRVKLTNWKENKKILMRWDWYFWRELENLIHTEIFPHCYTGCC